MMQLVSVNWWAFVLALIIGIAVAWWLFFASRRTRVEIKAFDALEEGAGPAKRNQALIDTPVRPVTTLPNAAATAAGADDLTRIKGLGPKIAAMLNGLGVTSLAQIASWNDDDIDRFDARLTGFEGRIRRDNWVEQAQLLHQDDKAGFEARFGKLEPRPSPPAS
jgi:predicted flap endonuclease-1-like 5' DNA nuclease